MSNSKLTTGALGLYDIVQAASWLLVLKNTSGVFGKRKNTKKDLLIQTHESAWNESSTVIALSQMAGVVDVRVAC